MNTALSLIPIAKLKLSGTASQAERRSRFDKSKLTELAESLKAVGMLQPIVARQVNGHHEIVAGERRYLAAKEAGIREVPVSVRDLTDEQVLEVQLVENLQREDLHELAEAEGYEGLAKLGYSTEQMAEKVGKSKATVYARMKLLALCKEARKAFYDGKLNSSTALLLARIPVEQLQKQALKEITQPRYMGQDGMSVREASRHIHDHYMLRLSSAGFKTEDETLVPGAGACGKCPKRTGNQVELFGDVKGADVCTDPICFKAKLSAHAQRAIAAANERGQTVISGAQAKKVAPYGVDSSLAGYVRLEQKDYSDSKSRTYRQILGKGFEPTLLQDEESGKLIEVAAIADLPKEKRGGADSADRSRREQREQEKKRRVELAYRAELLRRIHAANYGDDAAADLRLACEAILDRLHHDGKKRFFDVLGFAPIEVKDRYRGTYKDYNPNVVLKSAKDESSLWRLLRALCVAGNLEVYSQHESKQRSDRLHQLAKRVGINASKVEKELQAAAAAKAKPAKKKAARKTK